MCVCVSVCVAVQLDNTVGALEDAMTAYEYNKESVAAVYRVVEYATE